MGSFGSGPWTNLKPADRLTTEARKRVVTNRDLINGCSVFGVELTRRQVCQAMVALQVCRIMESWLQTASTRSIQLTGLKMALVVGTILNLINQGDSILGGNWELIHWPKLLLTYCVPYCVAVYAGTAARKNS